MDSFTAHLLNWYDRHARQLPWRVGPHDLAVGVVPNPYHVWLSEVMLQQTTVATVKAYFEKFIGLWPTIQDLAAANTDDVMAAWAGLGYYSRARNLKACAERVVHEFNGQFPISPEELRKLPGIGDYTSAAIATIAFGEMAEVVDGNVERVVTRFTANSTPLPAAKQDCREFMGSHTPPDRPGDFVQAMMDLGATICTPKKPACALCPVNSGCEAHRAGTMLNFPIKPPKKVKPTRKGAAFVALSESGAVWLQRRAEKGLLGGMAGVPTTNWTVRSDGDIGTKSAPADGDWQKKGVVRHTFTHFHLELEVWSSTIIPLTGTLLTGDGWWSDPEDLPGEALPTVMKKAITAALPDAFRG